jgi:transposase
VALTYAALPNDIEELKQRLLQHSAWVDALRDEVIRLRRWRFGPSSEILDPSVAPELPLNGGATPAPQPQPCVVDAQAPKAPKLEAVEPVRHSRATGRAARALPSELPRVVVEHRPAHCQCPECGGALSRLGEDISEQLDYVPGYFQVMRHVRPKLACRGCARIVQAAAPTRPIERALPTAALLAQVIGAKYADHCPLYRQEGIYRRSGLELPRAMLASWVGEAGRLLDPLVGALERHVMGAQKLHADDTPVPVLSPGRGKTRTGRLWAYVRDDRPSAGPDPPAVLYRYSPDRKSERPRTHLRTFAGILQADGYSGFAALYADGRVQEAACWAHARRKYYDVYAADRSPTAFEALLRIGRLYAIERQIRGQPPAVRAQGRQAQAAPLLTDLHTWLTATHKQLSAKSPLAGAIQYTLARWAALTRYVEDGRIEIGRVDDWRGAHMSRGVAVTGRAGASVRCMCSVSSRRSSNRTCRFPASGSHAWVSGLRIRHGGPTGGEFVEAEFPVKVLVRVLAIPGASSPFPSDQPAPQTATRVPLDNPVCADDATLIEVAGPAAQQHVEDGYSSLSRFQIPSRCRLVMDPLDDALERFTRRLRTDEGPAVPAVKPPDRIAEEVERLRRNARQPGLSVIHRQPQPRHQPPHFGERRRPVSGSAADHQIVSIIDDVRIESRAIAVVVPRQKKASEVEVRKERRCRSSLRGTSFPVASFRRADQPPSASPFTHRRREPPFEHRQHCAIGHPAGDALHQRTMRDRCEVVGKVRIYYFPSAMLGDMKVRATHCHLRVHPWTEPVLLRSQVRFENGAEHDYHGGLDHAVPDRRYAQRSPAIVSLWNPYAQKRLRHV